MMGRKYFCNDVIYTIFKKHYCPVCETQLSRIKVSKIVNSKSPEAKNYDFSGGDGFMVGDVEFVWDEFYCETCDKTISIDEMKRIERTARFSMHIREVFDFLITDYGLEYKHQEFINAYDGNWTVQAYSFYNNSGCFTIHNLVQRDELDFYYSPKFSQELSELCGKGVNICTIEPEIWDKHTKIWRFKRPFFWLNNNKVLSVFAEVLKTHLSKNKEFFGIQI
ncbi:MAG: hypothetical protein E7531_02510 [Ruminococcaceae bacterium]|nr:hypothetical protein [Oscillospiraceae bacterium]